MQLKGIDVSSYQGDIYWPDVAGSGKNFVYVKATEGLHTVDPNLVKNVNGAKAAGLAVGVYHFAHPELHSALDEANFFLNTVSGLSLDLPHILDIEVGSGNLNTWAKTWLQAVESHHPVGWYTYPAFMQEHSLNLPEYMLWVASYNTAEPTMPHKIWQYSESGSCPGIRGNVDVNVASPSLMYFAPSPGTNQAQVMRSIGFLGYKTIADFQKANGLVADGIYGPLTQAKLKEALQ